LVPFHSGFQQHCFAKPGRDQAEKARRFDADALVVQGDERDGMAATVHNINFKWLGPLALLAALVIGDQIRINRPGHKYRLTVDVQTPEGTKLPPG
jgi:hypothetical protein